MSLQKVQQQTSVIAVCVFIHTHLYKINIPRSGPTQLEVQSSPKGILAWEERQSPPTDPEQAEMSPCDPFCSEATLLHYAFLSLPKGMEQWCTAGGSEDWLTLARESSHRDLFLNGKALHQGSFFRVKGECRSVGAFLCLCYEISTSSHPSVAKPCSSQGIRSPAHAFPN